MTTDGPDAGGVADLVTALRTWRASVGADDGTPVPAEVDDLARRLQQTLDAATRGTVDRRSAVFAHLELGWWHHLHSWGADGERDRREFSVGVNHFSLARLLSNDTVPAAALPSEVARCARDEQPDGTWQMLTWLNADEARLQVLLQTVDTVEPYRALVAVRRRLLAAHDHGDEQDRFGRVGSLASAVRMLGTRTADRTLLDEAAALLRSLLGAGLDPTHEAVVRTNLSNVLWELYGVTNEVGLLHDAWTSARTACALVEDLPERRLTAMTTMARVGLVLYQATGEPDVLTTSLAQARSAFDDVTEERPEASTLAVTLAQLLTWRYALTGQTDDLDRRVELGRYAVRTAGPVKQLVFAHAALAEALSGRYWQLDDPVDLEEAVENQQEAVDLLEPDDPRQHEMRSNLAVQLRALGALRRSRELVDRAVDESARALELCRPDDPGRPRTLETAASALVTRYELLDDLADLDTAEERAREAVRVTREIDPELARRHGHLARILEARLFVDWDTARVDELVGVGEAAVAACQATATEYVGHVYALACFHVHRYRALGDEAAAHSARRLFADAGAHPLGPAELRYKAAVESARLAEALGDRDEAYAGYRAASRLLAELAWRGVPLSRRVRALAGHGWVVSAAAELALEAGRTDDALDVLEEGRQQIWQQDSELSGDLSTLRRIDPGLAADVEAARALLARAEHAPGATATADHVAPAGAAVRDTVGEQRRTALARWDEVVARARTLPGLHDLLRRPATSELMHALGERRVVYVVAGRRCGYALLLRDGELRSLRLPRATRAAAEEAARAARDALDRLGDTEPEWVGTEIRHLLEWCWYAVVAPVLRALDWIDAPDGAEELASRRLWWCPTGPLVSMPLHAAQSTGEGTLGVITALERCVSSFTGSLAGLAGAVRRATDAAPATEVALVGCATGVADHPLAHVHDELDAVAAHVRAGERRDEPAPTVAAVLDLVERAPALHIASHARSQDRETTAALLLHDGALELPMLGARRPARPAWAFVSACGTAEAEPGTADEHLTLAAGFQAAGYPYVVGTLWSVVDDVAVETAGAVYGHVVHPDGMDLSRTAAAMSSVSLDLRRRYPAYPFLWAGHVHFGPD